MPWALHAEVADLAARGRTRGCAAPVGERPRWLCCAEIVRRLASRQADPVLVDDLEG